jgi:pimeloyl-ACP methyl ester carboxylesterase
VPGQQSFAAEAAALTEYAALCLSPVYFGVGVPRGHGEPVLVLPGLFANDLYLQPLRGWLMRIGYRPLASGLAFNAGCPERLSRDVEAAIARSDALTRGSLMIIGHSRGGMLGWAIALRLAGRVSGLVMLGSPAAAISRALRESPAGVPSGAASSPVADASTRARRLLDPQCEFPTCGCPFPNALSQPLPTTLPVVSIASRTDPIVPPSACHLPGAVNHLVDGSHSGLVANRAVYSLLATELRRMTSGAGA